MISSRLDTNSSLVGFLIGDDGEPISGTAQLRRTENDIIEIEIMWDTKNVSPINQWLSGVSFTNHNLPSRMRFLDGGGDVHTLIGFTVMQNSRTSTQLSPNEIRYATAILKVAIVVHDGQNDYGRIREMTSGSVGLYAWVEPKERSFNYWGKPYWPKATTKIGKVGKISMEIGLSGWITQQGRLKTEHSSVNFTTRSRYSTTWEDHINLHDSLTDLTSISSLRDLKFTQEFGVVGISKRDYNQGAYMSFCSPTYVDNLESYDISYLFRFEDIGASGVKQWMLLRKDFSKGIDSFLVAIRNPMTTTDACLQLGLAFEHIGYQIGIENGWDVEKADGGGVQSKISRVVNDIAFTGKRWKHGAWSASMADSYNTVKHNKLIPQPEHIIEQDSTVARKVLRAWVASRLGLNGDSILTHRSPA